jgi:hypothetical protein
MEPTHEREIVVSDRSIRVQGDFGGGYTAPFTPDNRRAAILRAIVYLPRAKLIGVSADERRELGIE